MLISLAFRNLFRNFRRTLAVLMTIALGTGALFSFDGFICGVLTSYRDSTIHSHYGFGQIHTQGYRETVYEEPTNHWIVNANELEETLLDMDEVERVFPRANFSALITAGNITVSGSGQGIEAAREADFFHRLDVEEGEPLVGQEKGILLGRGMATALDVRPGDAVQVTTTATTGEITTSEFKVTGIFHTGSVEFDSRIFRVQLKQAQDLLKTSKIELVSLALRDLGDWERVAKMIGSSYPELEATPFNILDKIYYQHSVDWLKAQFRVVLMIILGIVVLGIFNSISSSILERKQEIGNLRANGESVFQVMQLILIEGILLALLGTCIGVGLSYSVLTFFIDQGLMMPPGPGMTRQFAVTFKFEWSMVLFALMLSCIASFIASFLAGIRVAKMSISKCLRAH